MPNNPNRRRASRPLPPTLPGNKVVRGTALQRTASTSNTTATNPAFQPDTSPTGTAAGDLAKTFPNPWVVALHEASANTRLQLGGWADQAVLMRNGNTAIGVSLANITAANVLTSNTVTLLSNDFLRLVIAGSNVDLGIVTHT